MIAKLTPNDRALLRKAHAALLDQGRPSYLVDADGDILCAYRDGYGNRCAAGMLIPDDEYNPNFESVNASGLSVDCSLRDRKAVSTIASMSSMGLVYLNRLQRAHDCAARVVYSNGREGEFIDLYLQALQEFENEGYTGLVALLAEDAPDA